MGQYLFLLDLDISLVEEGKKNEKNKSINKARVLYNRDKYQIYVAHQCSKCLIFDEWSSNPSCLLFLY